MLQREGYVKNKFEQTGNSVPTMEGEDDNLLRLRAFTYFEFIMQNGPLRNKNGNVPRMLLGETKTTRTQKFFQDGMRSVMLKLDHLNISLTCNTMVFNDNATRIPFVRQKSNLSTSKFESDNFTLYPKAI